MLQRSSRGVSSLKYLVVSSLVLGAVGCASDRQREIEARHEAQELWFQRGSSCPPRGPGGGFAIFMTPLPEVDAYVCCAEEADETVTVPTDHAACWAAQAERYRDCMNDFACDYTLLQNCTMSEDACHMLDAELQSEWDRVYRQCLRRLAAED